jgi:predicted phosphohydrolase
MRVYAIGDTHLSFAHPKPMDIFGEQWAGHAQHIRDNWKREASEDDLLLLAGDISWALRLDEAAPDLDFIAQFPGRKLLLKGNHDYWWGSIARVRSAAPPTLEFLQNDAHMYAGVAVAGARGWSLPGTHAPGGEDAKLFDREIERLRLSLQAAQRLDHSTLIVMTHFPPLRSLSEATPISELVEQSGARVCVYGHLHGRDIETAAQGERNGVHYKLVSADAVGFTPWLVWPRAGSA